MSDIESESDSPPSEKRSPRIRKYHMRQYLKLLQRKEQIQEWWRAYYEDQQFKARNQGRLKVLNDRFLVEQGAEEYVYYTRTQLCLLADKHEEYRDETRKEISKLKSEIEQGVSFEAWREILVREDIDLDRVQRQELSRMVEFIMSEETAEELADSTETQLS